MQRLLRRVLINKIFQLFAIFMFIYLVVYVSETRRSVIKQNFSAVKEEIKFQKCDVIHLGAVIVDYTLCLDFYYVLKSILFQRRSSLHFHIIVDNKSEYILKTLFQTWLLAQVNVTFYNTRNIDTREISEENVSYILPQLLSEDVDKLIIIKNKEISFENIYKLWKLVENFNDEQTFAIINIEDIYSEVQQSNEILLFKLNRLQSLTYRDLTKMMANSDQYKILCPLSVEDVRNCYDVENNIVFTLNELPNHSLDLYNGHLLKPVEGDCQIIEKLITPTPHPSLRYCSEFYDIAHHTWRTLLFIKNFECNVSDYDITFVSQLSYPRVNLLEELARAWEGPMSFAVYLSDKELPTFTEFLNNSSILRNRLNIGYHIVFQEDLSLGYPINVLRNVALNHVTTPYVFLIDIDFIPSENIYSHLKLFLNSTSNVENKAFIIPAFESKTSIPRNKGEVLAMMKNGTVNSFHVKQYAKAHAPTNFAKWKLVEAPYEIKWKPEFEPYVVVSKNVPRYDTRFFGYGWNKVSHIIELARQNYSFIVLHDVFVVHKGHAWSKDKKNFLKSRPFKICLARAKKMFLSEKHIRIVKDKFVFTN